MHQCMSLAKYLKHPVVKGKYLGKYCSHALKMCVELPFPGILLHGSGTGEVPSRVTVWLLSFPQADVEGRGSMPVFCWEITSPFSFLPRQWSKWQWKHSLVFIIYKIYYLESYFLSCFTVGHELSSSKFCTPIKPLYFQKTFLYVATMHIYVNKNKRRSCYNLLPWNFFWKNYRTERRVCPQEHCVLYHHVSLETIPFVLMHFLLSSLGSYP